MKHLTIQIRVIQRSSRTARIGIALARFQPGDTVRAKPVDLGVAESDAVDWGRGAA